MRWDDGALQIITLVVETSATINYQHITLVERTGSYRTPGMGEVMRNGYNWKGVGAAENPLALVSVGPDFILFKIGRLYNQGKIIEGDTGCIETILYRQRIITAIMFDPADSFFFDSNMNNTIFQQASRTIMAQPGAKDINRLIHSK